MMGVLRGVALRLRALFRRSAAERDLDDEIRLHLELETEARVRQGIPADEARRLARLAFGGVEAVKEAHRDARGVRWVDDTVGDVRFALRALRRNPVLAATAILTLALGIGANTAIFSVVNAVILRPLPFPAGGRLMMLSEDNPEKGWHQQVAAPANYLDWKDRVPAFLDVAAYAGTGQTTLTGMGAPVLLTTSNVTGNFFSVLGARATQGRTFLPEETWVTGSHIAVISQRLADAQFGSGRDPRGRTLTLDGIPTQVVGVVPQGIAFPSPDVDIWTPMEWKPTDRSQVWFRRAHWIRVVARLRAGVSVPAANEQFQTAVRQLQVEYPATNRVMGADLEPLHDFLVGSVRRPLLVLLGAVAVLLLIACANVGNLLLVQALGRQRESALRLALGAGRTRLVRQALTESLVLSALGGLAGLGLGWAGTRALAALQPAGMLPVRDVNVAWGVLAYVAAITTAGGLLFGIAPALWHGRREPAEVLKEGDRGGSQGARMRRWGSVLVVAEIAMTLLLTVGAGLLVRSFWRLQRVDPGFDPHGVLTVSVVLPTVRYDTSTKVIAFFDELRARVRALPGATDAADVLAPSLSALGWTSDFHIAGRPPDQYGTEVAHRVVTPDYFRVMRVPLRAGRLFTDADREGAPPVVLVNDALALQQFPGADPVGQRIAFEKQPDSSSIWYTIVGVVGSERQASLAIQPQIETFVPFAQQPNSAMTVVVRTDRDPERLGPAIRRVVAELDPNIAISSMVTMETLWSRSIATQRFFMILLLTFAVVGVSLAVVGVYGVMAQLTRRRTREMGIRMALGANASQVQWLVVLHGLRLLGSGLALGLAGAFAVTRAMTTLLYEVTPRDSVTYLTVPALLGLTAVVAAWLPAARASRADPAGVLRAD
jgi:putative ABC transport system permease protein